MPNTKVLLALFLVLLLPYQPDRKQFEQRQFTTALSSTDSLDSPLFTPVRHAPSQPTIHQMLPERAVRKTFLRVHHLVSVLLCVAIWATTLRIYQRLAGFNPNWMVPSWTAFFAIVGAVSFIVGCVSVFVLGYDHGQPGDGSRNACVDERRRKSGGSRPMVEERMSKSGKRG